MDIPLTRGLVAIIDDADAGMISKHSWYASVRSHSGIFYAATSMRQGDQRVYAYMHRLLIGALKGQSVDHINGNSLDNRRSNLRFATSAENQLNQKQHGGTSRFKGVHLIERQSKPGWVAQITFRRLCRHLGIFDSEEEAAAAYDRAARLLHKEFARLNLP